MNARPSTWVLAAIACTALLMLPSCGDDCDDQPVPPVTTATATSIPGTPTAPAETLVSVTLQEFSVTLDRDSAPAGRVTFLVTNAGSEPHEFLVVKTDLPADQLPTEEDGSYEEDGPGTELLAEIEPFPPGDPERTLTLELEAGNYVVLCNLVEIEDDEVEAHYELGMFASFSVE